jgi:hypothetical protein
MWPHPDERDDPQIRNHVATDEEDPGWLATTGAIVTTIRLE